jgi:hypothetical protein
MARKHSRTRACTREDAAQRLAQAQAFADLAEMDPYSSDGPTRSAAVSNAVLAASAASDAVCCKRLGRHSSDGDHARALELLSEAGEAGGKAHTQLATLLSLKNKASYERTDPTVAEAKKAIRSMKAIIKLAREL